jgi:hypothetical protein
LSLASLSGLRKAVAYPSGATFRWSTLGYSEALPTNIELGLKKGFTGLTPGVNVIKLYFFIADDEA